MPSLPVAKRTALWPPRSKFIFAKASLRYTPSFAIKFINVFSRLTVFHYWSRAIYSLAYKPLIECSSANPYQGRSHTEGTHGGRKIFSDKGKKSISASTILHSIERLRVLWNIRKTCLLAGFFAPLTTSQFQSKVLPDFHGVMQYPNDLDDLVICQSIENDMPRSLYGARGRCSLLAYAGQMKAPQSL